MRLIDADALTKRHCEGCTEDVRKSCADDPVCASLMWVVEEPTIDAVPVVRCKDCRFYETDVEYYGGGTKDVCRLLKRQMQCDDFCSYGERKDT